MISKILIVKKKKNVYSNFMHIDREMALLLAFLLSSIFYTRRNTGIVKMVIVIVKIFVAVLEQKLMA